MGCEWLIARIHSEGTDQQWDDGTETRIHDIVPGDYFDADPKCRFLILSSCEASNYMQKNLAAHYLFSSSWICGVTGSTYKSRGLFGPKGGSSGMFFDFIDGGSSIGAALQGWATFVLSITCPPADRAPWNEVLMEVYFGDPSIIPEMHNTSVSTTENGRM